MAFGLGLSTAVLWPRDRTLLRRSLKVALVSLLLGVVIFAGIYLVVTFFERMAIARLGNRWRDYFAAISISIEYGILMVKLCCFAPLLSFAALRGLRRHWALSDALLLALANLPVFVAAVVVFAVRYANR